MLKLIIIVFLFISIEAQAKVLVPAYTGGYPVTVCQPNDSASGCSGVANSGNIGIGTVGIVPVYIGVSTIGPSSNLYAIGNNVGIGTPQPNALFQVVGGGNTGINSTSPGQQLDIQGTTRISGAGAALDVYGTARVQGFTLSSSPTNGYVLTSDANGNGNWQAASAGSPGGNLNAIQYNSPVGTFAGKETQFSFNGTNIGIGTTNGINLFDVQGTTAKNIFEINPAGNIGIGSKTPGQVLDIQGTARALYYVNALTNVSTANPSSAASFTFSNLVPGIQYDLVMTLIQNTGVGSPYLIFNSDSGNNYFFLIVQGGDLGTTQSNGGTDTQIELSNTNNTNTNGTIQYHLNFCTFPGNTKKVRVVGMGTQVGTAHSFAFTFAGYYTGAADLSSVTIGTNSQSLSGIAQLYEYN